MLVNMKSSQFGIGLPFLPKTLENNPKQLLNSQNKQNSSNRPLVQNITIHLFRLGTRSDEHRFMIFRVRRNPVPTQLCPDGIRFHGQKKMEKPKSDY